MGNEAVQVLKLVLISFGAFRYLFCSDSNFKPIIYCQFTASEFMRSDSQQKFAEEYKISENTMKSFQSIFRVLCNMHIWHNQ